MPSPSIQSLGATIPSARNAKSEANEGIELHHEAGGSTCTESSDKTVVLHLNNATNSLTKVSK